MPDQINKYQVINGGIFGTGPQQFEALEKHIDEFYDIEKVITPILLNQSKAVYGSRMIKNILDQVIMLVVLKEE